MGKKWDIDVPSVEIWQEALRVIKPGAFMFVMSAPRLDVQSEMANRIKEAGFNIAFTPIYWTYFTGFPKAMNVSRKLMSYEEKILKMRDDDEIWEKQNHIKLENVSFVEKILEKIVELEHIKKKNSVVENVIVSHNQKKLQLNVKIVEKKLLDPLHISKNIIIVPLNVDMMQTRSDSNVIIVEKTQNNQDPFIFKDVQKIIFVPLTVQIKTCEQILVKIKGEEVLRIDYGKKQLLNGMDINAFYVEVIENWKHIILKQLKIIQNSDITFQMELPIAMNVIIIRSIMAPLITNMENILRKEMGMHKIGDYEHPQRKNRTYQTTSNIFSGNRKGDIIDFEKEKLLFDDHKNTKHTRQNPYHSGKNMVNVPTGLEVGKSIYSQVNLPDKRVKINGRRLLPLTKPASEEAKQAEGAYAGFNPKPAVEVIMVAMKPLSEKSYTDQFLENGKGVTWFGNCRVPYPELQEAINANKKGYATQTDSGVYGWNNGKGDHTAEFWKTEEGLKLKKKIVGGRLDHGYTIASERLEGYKLQEIDKVDPNLKGRFPANLIVSDNVLDNGTITKSKPITSKLPTKGSFAGSEGNYIQDDQATVTKRGYNDVGDQSRFFSLDLWYEGQLNRIPDHLQYIFPFLTVPKPSKSEKNKGLSGFEVKQATDGCIRSNPESARKYNANYAPSKNSHPTTKPVKLMQYLILLGSQIGDVILDPFAGSGTTCVASKLEDRKYIGIEMDPEYFEIMKARVRAYKTQRKLSSFF